MTDAPSNLVARLRSGDFIRNSIAGDCLDLRPSHEAADEIEWLTAQVNDAMQGEADATKAYKAQVSRLTREVEHWKRAENWAQSRIIANENAYKRLQHDLARYMDIASQEATESARLRAELANDD